MSDNDITVQLVLSNHTTKLIAGHINPSDLSALLTTEQLSVNLKRRLEATGDDAGPVAGLLTDQQLLKEVARRSLTAIDPETFCTWFDNLNSVEKEDIAKVVVDNTDVLTLFTDQELWEAIGDVDDAIHSNIDYVDFDRLMSEVDLSTLARIVADRVASITQRSVTSSRRW